MVADKEGHLDTSTIPNSPSGNLRSPASSSDGGGWATYAALQLDLQGHCHDGTSDNAGALLVARQTQASTFKRT